MRDGDIKGAILGMAGGSVIGIGATMLPVALVVLFVAMDSVALADYVVGIDEENRGEEESKEE